MRPTPWAFEFPQSPPSPGMTAARKRSREEALFTFALAQPADRRAGFLDRACGDEALRARIEALLNAHHAAGTLIGGERPKPAAPDAP